MKLKLFITIICISFLLACGGAGNNSNNTTNSNTPKANLTNTENKNTEADNRNAENKNTFEGVNESGKIKPDTNAKLENGKVLSTPFFDVTLPAGWQPKKSERTGFFTYSPSKTVDGELVEITLGYDFATETSNPEKGDPRKWLEKNIESAKKSKDDGYFDEFGTFGVGTNPENATPPVLGVMRMRDRPHKDLKDEFKNDKCSSINFSACGVLSWDGYMVKEEKMWSFTAIFPPATYEKNKPMIDAILNSVKFK